MSNKNIAFRTSVRGYNKKDVYEYIDKVNRDIADKEQKFISDMQTADLQIKALEEKNSQLSSESLALNAKIDSLSIEFVNLRTQISEKDSKINELECENNTNHTKIRELSEEISKKDELLEEVDSAAVRISIELDRLTEQYNTLSEEYNTLRESVVATEELRRKASAYDIIAQKAKTPSTSSALNAEHVRLDDGIDITSSAAQLLEQIKSAQQKFLSTMISTINETEKLKKRIESISSKSTPID